MSSSGASSSKSPQVSTPSEIAQVNESLFELYKPPKTPSLQILFFHGLQLRDYSNAHISAWESADGSCIWPQTWLVDEFPDAHIFSASYSGALNANSVGNIDMYNVIENLLSDLMEQNIGQVPYCPVILVGHSIGGLVIKALCSEAHEKLYKSQGSAKAKLEKFLGNVRGLFFYATPNHGSEYAHKLANIINSSLLTFFKRLNNDTARLNQEFNDTCKMHDRWLLAGLGEGLPTRLPTMLGLSKNVLIVPEASARESDFQLMGNVDHFSICKPRGRNFRNFYKLKGFLDRIAKDMTEEAEHPSNYQHLPASIAGIDDQLNEILGKLANCRALGLFGMGGLGKTTLAKAAFNTLGPQFEYTCFVPNFKKIEGDVKTKAWEQMHCRGRRVREECNWFTLRGKTVLLALDDISDDISSMPGISILLNLVKATSSDSRVIVTSRERELEREFDSIYCVRSLTKTAAREVFLSHAFSEKARPSHTLENVVEAIVSKCEGLPLALEVLGKYLYAANDMEWGQILGALENGEVWSGIEKKLLAILRISYNSLSEEEQQIFLDATTFFSNTKWTLSQAKAAWRVTYGLNHVELQWRTLVKLSLVHNVEDHECIRVHEQLQYLGRSIASEATNNGKRRVWDGNMGVEVLTNTRSVNDKEMFALHLGSWDNFGRDIRIPSSALRRLKSLQYLEVRGLVVIDGARRGESVPTNLVLLRCSASRFSRGLLQQALRDHLVVLELEGPCENSTLSGCLADAPSALGKLESEVETQLDLVREPNRVRYTSDMQSILGTIVDFSKLEFLDLHGCGCVWGLPQTFGQLSSLKHLKISSFRNLSSLPESFGQLSSLTHLGFYACRNLKSLPESCGQLKKLRDLEVVYCDEFHTLPESFGDLEALSHVKFSWCSKLSTLPESFGRLKALSHLDFAYCKALHVVPESFGDLKALSYLKFKQCSQLGAMPDTFGNLKVLRHLEFSNCEGLYYVPESVTEIEALRDLVLLGCPKLRIDVDFLWNVAASTNLTLTEDISCRQWGVQRLPESLERFKTIRTLQFEECTFRFLPETFGDLEALSYLKFRRCSLLETLPESFGKLKSLSQLEFDACKALRSLPESFGQLESLRRLDFYSCTALSSLPESFGQLKSLSWLKFRDCTALHSLPESFGQLKSLSMFAVSGLHSLPESFGQLKSLNDLHFHSCTALSSLPESFGQLELLSQLEFSSCTALHSLPESFGQLKSLRWLKFRDCTALRSLPESFGQLTSLSTLILDACTALRSLPGSFGQLTSLSTLILDACTALRSLPGSFGQLTSLSTLQLDACTALRSLPGSFGQLKSLKQLKLDACTALSSLPESFGQLESLSWLDFYSLTTLSSLPESFGQLKSLRYLHFDSCTALRSLPGSFGQLKSLKQLKLDACTALSALPESFGQLESLSWLDFYSLTTLSSLPESFGQLKALSSLCFDACTALRCLPESFRQLEALQSLFIGECPLLCSMPKSFKETGRPGNFCRLQSVKEEI